MRNRIVELSVVWVVAVIGCATDDGADEPSCGDGVCLGESSASCPADCSASGPRCGDGSCTGVETPSTCPGDCGSSACSQSPDNCTGETICLSGTCVAAFPRVYAITNVSVAVPTTNPNDGNASWDTGGGAPDMYLGDETGVAITTAVQDQFSASFAGPFQVSLIGGAELRIYVWDEDLTVADYAYDCGYAAVTAAALRVRTLSCASSGITFTSTIRPQ